MLKSCLYSKSTQINIRVKQRVPPSVLCETNYSLFPMLLNRLTLKIQINDLEY